MHLIDRGRMRDHLPCQNSLNNWPATHWPLSSISRKAEMQLCWRFLAWSPSGCLWRRLCFPNRLRELAKRLPFQRLRH